MGEDDIVISGISGRYPKADNIEELWNNLINGKEMYIADDSRWPVGYVGLPQLSGNLKDITKVDADFFKMGEVESDFIDPQYRIFHEVVYESIYDSGIIPEALRGSNTA
ncbi:fatty acid synthase-like protein, partial [Dinothrombium tinctorium]